MATTYTYAGSFPLNPTIGNTLLMNSTIYRWNSVAWEIDSSAAVVNWTDVQNKPNVQYESVIPDATALVTGLATAAQITKLDGIEASATADQTNAQIKNAYEANANTNVFSDAEQTKLSGIATSANNYSHPSSDGNLHVPATGTTNNGKVLTAGSTAGALTWETASLGGVNITASITPPTSPTEGDQWFDTSDGVLYVSLQSNWIDISTAGGGASGSLELLEKQVVTSSVASVEFTTPLTQYDRYFLMGSSLAATADGFVRMQIKKDNAFVTTSYKSSFQFQSVTSTSLYSQLHTSSTDAILGLVNIAVGSSFQAYLSNGKGGAEFIYDSDAAKDGGSFARLVGTNNASNSSVQGLKLVAETGSFVGGTFTLFGIKDS